MGPGERVMIIGNSREPFTCVKKDEKAFMSFWAKHIFLPPPDYASRKVGGGSQGELHNRGLWGGCRGMNEASRHCLQQCPRHMGTC